MLIKNYTQLDAFREGTLGSPGVQGEQWWWCSLSCLLVALETSPVGGTTGETAALQEGMGVTVDLQLNMNWHEFGSGRGGQ